MHMAAEADEIFSSIALPSGRILSNRLVKVALYEHLAKLHGGPPNNWHSTLYSNWANHDWGMIITGNVQVSPHHLSLARDLVIPAELSVESVRPFKELAAAMHGARKEKDQPVAIMQLSHAGRQSPNILGGRFPFFRPLAPSNIRLGSSLKNNNFLSDLIHRIMFQVPRDMSPADIDEVVESFVRGARLASQAGYDGVELHVAHGYLLAQFISSKCNTRIDEYSCSPDNALRLLRRIVHAIRAAVASEFILGVKINSADYADSNESPALEHILSIASWGTIDFIEISGGDYEKPDFLTTAPSASSRQAIFAKFSNSTLRALELTPRAPLVLLTGGLISPAHLRAALTSRDAHLLGIGRSAILHPDLPHLLKQPHDPEAPFARPPDLRVAGAWILGRLPRIKLLGAGVTMAWYIVQLRRLAITPPGAPLPRPSYNLGGLGSILWMWVWFGPDFGSGHLLCLTLMLAVVLGSTSRLLFV
ncbi:hypothetical protein C8J57DRAFT_1279760 [Mycena rebaudengoi]|nr:hypothetical protein C8J57DRAFT_1279760 [Mycena rebaudengoi]